MYHISIGLAGNVYAGTTRKLKDGTLLWNNKSDCTNEFYNTLLSLISLWGKDNKYSFSDDKTEYIITLEKRNKE